MEWTGIEEGEEEEVPEEEPGVSTEKDMVMIVRMVGWRCRVESHRRESSLGVSINCSSSSSSSSSK